MGLSIMEETPGWEQALRAFNQGNHESYIDKQHWIGEQRMDSVIPSEMPLALSGVGDGDTGNQAFQFLSQAEKDFFAYKNQEAQAKLQASQQRMSQRSKGGAKGGGGGGSWIDDNMSTILILGAVIVGGVILFSAMGKKKGGGEAHAA